MWHEARKQEKLLRARIVDCSRRAEQRRKYYENVRKDPDQFMQLHGRGSTIHADKSIAKAAEEQNILRKWQGDPDILIDRFDARSHLDYIPPPRTTRIDEKSAIAKEETVCDFERYRLLIINEFKDVSEKTYLRKIAEKEFWLTSNNEDYRKLEMEKKKKSGEGKASIGFSYNDSDVVRGNTNEESDEEIDDEVQDIDVDLDLSKYSADSQRRANKIGEDYGIKLARFTGLLAADQHASREAAELKRIERQKSMLAGREGKQGRQILKRQRALIVGKGVNDEATLSFKFREKAYEDKNKYLKQESSSSDSSDDEPAKTEFITTFGGVEKDDDDEEDLIKPGPAELVEKMDPACMKILQFAAGEATISVDSEQQAPPVKKISKSRAKSRSPSMSRRSRTSSPPCRPGGSPSPIPDEISCELPGGATGVEKEASITPESSDHGSDLELLEIRSSMSDSEKERVQIENRKRRVKRTKRMMKEKKSDKQDDDSEEEEKREIARKLKARLKKTLRQTVDEMREEEEAKKREAEKEKRIRDEIIFIEEQERKQREKKRRESSDRRRSSRSSSRSSSKSSNKSSKSSSRSRSKSKSRSRSRHRSDSRISSRNNRTRSRSRNRSRSRSRDRRSRSRSRRRHQQHHHHRRDQKHKQKYDRSRSRSRDRRSDRDRHRTRDRYVHRK